LPDSVYFLILGKEKQETFCVSCSDVPPTDSFIFIFDRLYSVSERFLLLYNSPIVE